MWQAWNWVWGELQHPLVLFGFAAQFVFMLRFVVQWVASEARRRSHVPEVFWWLSLAGGLLLFIYAVLKKDLVFSTGQLLGVLIYVRNLMLIHGRRSRVNRRRAERGILLDEDPEALDDDPARDPQGSGQAPARP